MKQVDRKHYSFKRYCYPDRWASYYYQLREIVECRPKSVLEVGVGDGVVKQYIQNNTDISYKNIDIAEDLNPDVFGSVDAMPLANDSFDLVCAFEVLEHLPFEKFEKCLVEMGRVSRRHVLISVPHFGPPIKFSLKFPFLREIKCAWKMPFCKKHVFNNQHYWELGKKGYKPKMIRNIVKKEFKILNEFIPFENQYHHFYILEKK